MRKIAYTILLAVMVAPATMAAERPARPPENIYVGPRWGYSRYFTGFLGVEMQVHHFAVAVGISPDASYNLQPGLCGGFKYYFDPQRSSFYVGVSGARVQQISVSTTVTENGVVTIINDYTQYKTTYGVGGGYRWRIGFGLDFSAGVGGGIAETSYEGIVDPEENASGTHFVPLLDLSMGFSF